MFGALKKWGSCDGLIFFFNLIKFFDALNSKQLQIYILPLLDTISRILLKRISPNRTTNWFQNPQENTILTLTRPTWHTHTQCGQGVKINSNHLQNLNVTPSCITSVTWSHLLSIFSHICDLNFGLSYYSSTNNKLRHSLESSFFLSHDLLLYFSHVLDASLSCFSLLRLNHQVFLYTSMFIAYD